MKERSVKQKRRKSEIELKKRIENEQKEEASERKEEMLAQKIHQFKTLIDKKRSRRANEWEK